MASLYIPPLTYDPIEDPQAVRANHYQIERSPGDGFIYEAICDPDTNTATPFYRADSLVIATTGSFLHERYCYPGPRASYSVFLGPGNELNDVGKSLAAPPGRFLSRQRGDLSGAISALRTVVRILEKGLTGRGPIRKVIIKTDSEYLVKSATEWVHSWIRKGWLAYGMSRISDGDLWEQLLDILGHARRAWGVEVAFWWVPVKWNKDAKSLARLGLRVPPTPPTPPPRQVTLGYEASRLPMEMDWDRSAPKFWSSAGATVL